MSKDKHIIDCSDLEPLPLDFYEKQIQKLEELKVVLEKKLKIKK